jgi:hypothetical protein
MNTTDKVLQCASRDLMNTKMRQWNAENKLRLCMDILNQILKIDDEPKSWDLADQVLYSIKIIDDMNKQTGLVISE